jgi:type 1 glutamine amidotransferase
MTKLLLMAQAALTATVAAPEEMARAAPIAWYRELDGGRTFYTALGHTSASCEEPAFLDHLWGGLTWVMGS